MSHKNLNKLCEMATEAHTRFQQEIKAVDPIVGVSQSMRANGVPADAMTIDCLKSGKRIIIVLHDQQPDSIHYQFSWRDKDPEENFTQITFDDVTPVMIFDWMEGYFAMS